MTNAAITLHRKYFSIRVFRESLEENKAHSDHYGVLILLFRVRTRNVIL